jgi:DNA-binding MarR family transcriptional regulator
VQILELDGVDQVNGDEDGSAVMGRYSMHTHTISVNIRYGNAYHGAMSEPPRRPDLAAMLAPLLRQLVAAEQPILDAHGISMWGYVVLLALDRSSMRTQAALAEAINADKTRIIRTLDELQERGLIERRPDPDDRRVRLLAITDAGRAVKDAVQADIQRGEERWLGELGADERRVFLRVLQRLTPEEPG